jgi:hypothetical protein
MRQFLWDELVKRIRSLPKELFLPTGYKKTIISFRQIPSPKQILYKAGNTPYRLDFNEFCEAFDKSLQQIILTGNKEITSSDLKRFCPHTFDDLLHSGTAHSCHSSVFFLLLKELGLVGHIQGGQGGVSLSAMLFP